MFRDIIDRIKEAGEYILRSRLVSLIVIFILTSSILIGRLFYLQIVRGADYLENYELQIRKTKEIPGTRGNIYDRNGNLLAYNELAYSVTIEDTLSTDLSTSEKNEALNKILDRVLEIVESHGDSVIDSFGIILDSAGNYQFTQSSETQRLRFVADVYGLTTIDLLTSEQRSQSAADIVHHLCTDPVYGYGLDDSKEDPAYILKMVNMRYAMNLNSYQQYMSTILASDVSDETAAAIMENKDTLTGVDIEEDSLRRYTDGEYFSSIIGYTGQISQEEYNALDSDEKKQYSLSDIVGKSGLEQTLDSVLQGKKGKTTFYVDNLGKVTDTVSRTEPEAGNDVYLTIDKDLQEQTYHLIEEKVAGIVLEKLQNILNYDPESANSASDLIIPVSDVYHAFINNNIVDAAHFGSDDAGPAEKEVYEAFQKKKASAISDIMAQLRDSNAAPYDELSDEMQDYMDYISITILERDTDLLLTDQIDTSDETYNAWRNEENISLYTYLNYAISQNWIDTSKLGGSSYTSSEEIYQELLNYLEDYLNNDSDFDKLLYEYLIKSEGVSGAQICATAYEQGVLPMDEDDYNGLRDGSVSAYSWIREKIENLEITPGQLALEPCSGGAVVSDPQTGEVLACVSYPGYDNNRLANTMDSSYYQQLNTGLSRPFYNKATQERTAPGSTYKMVSAVAGLTEGVINGGSIINCSGVFTEVTPSPKCWISPGAHGGLDVVSALQESCNVFFYTVGYDLGIDDEGNYDSELGIQKLAEYAQMFGLGETSGVEIPESDPQISDEYAVQSAIGQGTNNYTVSQLNRYVAAVANSGTVYSLTLIDRTTDSNGKLISDNEPEVVNTMDNISSSTWDLVHEGMERMVSSSSTFAGLDISMAGKTGTAQISDTHPDNALFVGYAPTDNPEIAIAVRIANGYNSSYSAEIGRDITQIYFDLDGSDKIVTGKAAELGQANAGD